MTSVLALSRKNANIALACGTEGKEAGTPSIYEVVLEAILDN